MKPVPHRGFKPPFPVLSQNVSAGTGPQGSALSEAAPAPAYRGRGDWSEHVVWQKPIPRTSLKWSGALSSSMLCFTSCSASSAAEIPETVLGVCVSTVQVTDVFHNFSSCLNLQDFWCACTFPSRCFIPQSVLGPLPTSPVNTSSCAFKCLSS